MKKSAVVLLSLVCILSPAWTELRQVAVLMVLDKVSAKSKVIRIPVGSTYAFQTLDIKVQRCDKTLPQNTPEAAAYLTITEPEKSLDVIFQGWMFASNPSIYGLQHPVYDVWVKGCL